MAKNPIDNCDHCNTDYDLTKETAALNIYLLNPECHYIQAKCPHCDGDSRIFVIPSVAAELTKYLPIFVHGKAPKDIIAGWKSINEPEVKTPPNYEIPPSLEKEIARWHNALEDPHIVEEAELPAPPPKLPPRWRGDDNRPGASA